jgi:hypothetical protein
MELLGDFDGSSAIELINTLNDHRIGVDTICVNARGLRRIHAFGRDVIQKNMAGIQALEPYILFIGGNLGQHSY